VLSSFEYVVQNKAVPLFPMFAKVTKVEGEHQPASVVLNTITAPMDGQVGLIVMSGKVDPGVVDFDLDQGLELLLKIVRQRDEGVAGDRLKPFDIAMKDGVASFRNLAVPFGEFVFTGEGTFDLIKEYEDITLMIPAGAFSSEAFGLNQNPDQSLLAGITVPVQRKGPLGGDNKWVPKIDPGQILRKALEQKAKDAAGGKIKDLLENLPGLPGGGGGGGGSP